MGRNMNWALDPRQPRKATATPAEQVASKKTTKKSTKKEEA